MNKAKQSCIHSTGRHVHVHLKQLCQDQDTTPRVTLALHCSRNNDITERHMLKKKEEKEEKERKLGIEVGGRVKNMLLSDCPS